MNANQRGERRVKDCDECAWKKACGKDGRERRKADVQAEAGLRRTPFAFSCIMYA